MDNLIINVDDANKKCQYTASKVMGSTGSILVSAYNFKTAPDLSTMMATVYLDAGTPISNCGAFSETAAGSGVYKAVLDLQTPAAVLYFDGKPRGYSEPMTFVLSANARLYCNSSLVVKHG